MEVKVSMEVEFTSMQVKKLSWKLNLLNGSKATYMDVEFTSMEVTNIS